MRVKKARRTRAHRRVRSRVVGSSERPRLAVFKSLRFTYAQVIDDSTGRTLAQANSAEADLRGDHSPSSKEAAKAVGKTLAARVKEAGIGRVVFDRGGYIYHGKVQAVAEGARDSGLEF
jgi:large subunit ribosomal protein L18